MEAYVALLCYFHLYSNIIFPEVQKPLSVHQIVCFLHIFFLYNTVVYSYISWHRITWLWLHSMQWLEVAIWPYMTFLTYTIMISLEQSFLKKSSVFDPSFHRLWDKGCTCQIMLQWKYCSDEIYKVHYYGLSGGPLNY